jgi:hypothetical protein
MKKIVNHISLSKLLPFLFCLSIFIWDGLNPNPNLKVLPDNGKHATVAHEEYGFAIDYPTKWRVETYSEEGSWRYYYDSSIKLDLYIIRRIPFKILIRYRPTVSPTLEDVADWGSMVMNRIVTVRYTEQYPDTVNGQPVIKHRYYWGSYVTEDVYIARSSDMIIISMEVKQHDYDENIDDFNAIVESFRPLK